MVRRRIRFTVRSTLTRILIVGHSRGGEAWGHASLFNRLASIGAVVLDGLPPFALVLSLRTDRCSRHCSDRSAIYAGHRANCCPDSYYVIHGSKDSDVFTFEGYHTYERAHAVDLANSTVSDGKFKAMLWVHKANHNQFNSIWASETAPGVALTRANQEQVARVTLAPWHRRCF